MPLSPVGEIKLYKATLMKRLYSKIKLLALPQNQQNERTRFEFTPDDFLNLIKGVIKYDSSPTPPYDGVRIYYGVLYNNSSHEYRALTDGGKNDNKLVLILVPTIFISEKHHEDDLDNMWMTTGDLQVESSNQDSASDFTGKYRDARQTLFTSHGNKFLNIPSASYFQEAKCVWYSIKTITSTPSDPSGFCGLIEYISDPNNRVKDIVIHLAGVIEQVSDPEDLFHLSLVFTISDDQEKEMALTLAAITSDEKRFLETSADTGSPCPPPNNGCNGTKLPTS